jgi:hypothetical protein
LRVLGDDALDGVTTECPAANRGEHGILISAGALSKPSGEAAVGVSTERRASLFATLTLTAEMGSGTSRDVLAPELDELGNTKSSLDRDQEEHAIATAGPGRLGRSIEKRLDLRPTQECDRMANVALVRHREDALTLKGVCGFADRDVAEERSCGRQSHVSGARSVAALRLEVVEESADEGGVEPLESELRQWLPVVLDGEAE